MRTIIKRPPYRRSFKKALVRRNDTTQWGAQRIPRNQLSMHDLFIKLRYADNTLYTQSSGSLLQTISVLGGSFLNSLPDFASAAGLFDCYEVLGFLLEFVPTSTQASASATVTQQPILCCYDPDSGSSGLPTSQTNMLSYENCKTFQLLKKWSYYVKKPQVTYGAASLSAVQSHFNSQRKVAVLDCANVANYTSGSLYTRADNLSASSNGFSWGTVHLTWYTRFSSRR